MFYGMDMDDFALHSLSSSCMGCDFIENGDTLSKGLSTDIFGQAAGMEL